MNKANGALGKLLEYQIDGASRVVLSGHLTELADFEPLLGKEGPMTLDLAGISRIDSLGVHEWIEFVLGCERAGRSLTFERCSPVMVQQMSMISNFMGTRSQVRSLLVPYTCSSCGAEQMDLVEMQRGALRIESAKQCPKCGALMELDEPPESYALLRASSAR
jgi:hypothetical protein